MGHIVSFSIALVGYTAMVSQIVFVRELLVVFYGNELSIGFILASWLIGGAIGSYGFGRVADKIKSPFMAFAVCQLATGILLPVIVVSIRSIRNIIGANVGEIIPLFPMAVSSFVILGFLCAIMGFIFSLACRICGATAASGYGAANIGRVYVLEAIGSTLGGLSASLILIPFLNSFQITGALSFLNILSASILVLFFVEIQNRRLIAPILTVSLAVIITISCSGAWNTLNVYSLARQWQGYNLLAAKNSIYGNIVIGEKEGQFSFFENGLHLYTIPDPMTAEESVHYALLEHPAPKNVLLIGGGIGGLAEEVLKHGVERCDYVELDPLLIRMAETYLPDKYSGFIKKGRVSIEHIDGRLFVKRTNVKYDSVLLNLGEPATAQLNRYYTLEFFQEVKRILNEKGVISFALPSSENYIRDELGQFLGSVYATLKKAFASVIIIPGDTAHFIASDARGLLTYNYNILMKRASARGLKLRYVREYYMPYKMSKERVAYAEESLKNKSGAGINYDFRPISYYYNIVFWSSRFRDSIVTKILEFANRGRVLAAILSVCMCIFLSGLFGMRGKAFFRKAVLVSVAASGFGGMSFQIVALLSFQIIYGFLFSKLGLILTAFMVGLAVGGWFSTKIIPGIKRDRIAFIWAQVAICVYPLTLPLLIFWLPGSHNRTILWIGSNVLFLLLPIIAGFASGFHFPLANKIYLDCEIGIGRTAGLTYGMDLVGSCLGAILTPVFLIPLIGVLDTSMVLASFNLMALFLVILSFFKK